MKPTQCDAILAHLQAGHTLTADDAFRLCGTHVCHSRIAELRNRGHNIECQLVVRPDGRKIWQYRLERIAYG